MDNRGFLFHLPAFLTAELNDQHPYGYIERLCNSEGLPAGWFDLLNRAQREAIASILDLISEHPDYSDDIEAIRVAITRYLDE